MKIFNHFIEKATLMVIIDHPFLQGGLIYVNYGRLEDFNWLKERGINFSGCICIARNEQLARNNKVLLF